MPRFAATAPWPRSCCTLSNQAHDVWVAWTVARALGFTLGLLCTGRILQLRRRRRPGKQVGSNGCNEAAQAWRVAWRGPAHVRHHSPVLEAGALHSWG